MLPFTASCVGEGANASVASLGVRIHNVQYVLRLVLTLYADPIILLWISAVLRRGEEDLGGFEPTAVTSFGKYPLNSAGVLKTVLVMPSTAKA